MGDEVIFQVYKDLFPVHFEPIPDQRVLKLIHNLSRDSVYRGIFLGGGTLIGSRALRRRFSDMFEMFPDTPAFMLGTGVQDPDLYGEEHWPELRSWKEILGHFKSVSVRGPRSAEILRVVGVEAEIIGDPALLISDARAHAGQQAHKENLVGINVGGARRLWGSEESLFEQISLFARQLSNKGWTVRLIPVSPRDLAPLRWIANELRGKASLFEEFQDATKLLSSISECHVFVGQKLHSVVFASALGVPSLMLEYQPKCLDFQLSLERELFNLRTDSLEPSRMMDLTMDLAENRDSHSKFILSNVERRKMSIERAAAAIRRHLDLQAAS